MLDFYRSIDIADDIRVVKFISIDPGVRNFAIRVESIEITDNDKTTVHLFELVDLEFLKSPHKLIMKLDEYMLSKKHLFDDTTIVLIENQMKRNKFTLPIFHHLMGYFMHSEQFVNTTVIGLNPKFKGKVLGLTGLKYKKLKTQTSSKMITLFKEREDIVSLDIMMANHKKNDDLADTKAMIEAMMIHMRE